MHARLGLIVKNVGDTQVVHGFLETPSSVYARNQEVISRDDLYTEG